MIGIRPPDSVIRTAWDAGASCAALRWGQAKGNTMTGAVDSKEIPEFAAKIQNISTIVTTIIIVVVILKSETWANNVVWFDCRSKSW